MHRYACIYTYIYVHTYICMYIYTLLGDDAKNVVIVPLKNILKLLLHICIDMHVYIHIYMYIHIYIQIYSYVHICTYIHIYIYVHIYTGDDAKNVVIVPLKDVLKLPLAFDHKAVLTDYIKKYHNYILT
jgi:hypothetical protein